MRESDAEVLATREFRARLPLTRLVLVYLNPFALFKDKDLSFNRARRRVLLAYARRWAWIAIASIAAISQLGALARAQPLLWIALIVLEAAFTSGLFLSFLSVAAYVVLGLEP